MKVADLLRSGAGGKSERSAAALFRYSVAVCLVAVAAVTRLSLDSFLGQDVLPYSFFYLAVAVTAWWVGFRAALVAAFLGLFVGLWLIVPPRFSFVLRGLPDFMEVGVYLFVTLTLTGLIVSLRKARAEAQRSAESAMEKQRALEAEIQQRMKTEAALRESEALLERRVIERTAELRETVDELKRFSYAIIHDMRAPLRSMRGFAEIVEEECSAALPASSREHLRRIRLASQRMDRLIQDSLNYNNALLKALPLQPLDPAKLLRELCATYPDFRPHQARIQIEGAFPAVLGNDAALTQCFSILLGNAVTFVAEGVEPQIRVWAESKENKAVISVKDNGVGIPAATQRHLFGIFQRHDTRHEGTGIGLAIVRKLVQRMGGSVGVESEVGRGSRFWIELKMAQAAAASRPQAEMAGDHPAALASRVENSVCAGENSGNRTVTMVPELTSLSI